MSLLAVLEAKGISLNVENDRLLINTQNPLTVEQRLFFKSHKTKICAALRIKKLAPPDSDHADLLEWFKRDFEIIAGIDDQQLSFYIFDYLNRRDYYREQQGCTPYVAEKKGATA